MTRCCAAPNGRREEVRIISSTPSVCVFACVCVGVVVGGFGCLMQVSPCWYPSSANPGRYYLEIFVRSPTTAKPPLILAIFAIYIVYWKSYAVDICN